ncbi:MAG TPA: O-acetylhomoserine aminocarboxypropyltransferase [Gammaproteobacteria bacterium]|nr:O-acetylhomoserine aminocarboxypropyltransferase [Gammaproteobacteria bacterium]
MVKVKTFDFDTLANHAGQRPDSETGARAVPIYQTASYVFKDSDAGAAIFNIERGGHVYSRISNPTNAVLEERISALEGGVGAIATASGQAAVFMAIATLMDSGGHIVSSQSLYGGTHNLMEYTFPRFGITTTFVDSNDMDAFRAAIKPETRLIFGETVGNPRAEVFDIPVVSKIAHEHKIPLMIDSTFTTPYLMKPFDFGADIVVHSATKFLSGHGTVMGGLIVDGGIFDWESSNKFPQMTEKYAGFHNLSFTEEFGPAAYISRVRNEGARDFGACISPHTSFLILNGIETLSIRMDKHISNTKEVVQYLDKNDMVEWVSHPDLEDHPNHELAKSLLPRGSTAVFSFGIKGGRKVGQTFIDRLELFSNLANVGDAKSLVIHPASTTHQRMTVEALEAAGISEGLIRLSVGIESVNDLIEDLEKGFKAAAQIA